VAEEIASCIVDYLAVHAGESGEKTAVVCDDRGLRSGDLDNLSARCRRDFKDLGLERGDRVALIMCECPEWVVAFLGAIGLGAIAAPLGTTLSAAEIRAILKDCGARVAIGASDQRELTQAVLSEQSPPALEVLLVASRTHRRARAASVQPIPPKTSGIR
jgi:long-chain acyl-CoA synthetase